MGLDLTHLASVVLRHIRATGAFPSGDDGPWLGHAGFPNSRDGDLATTGVPPGGAGVVGLVGVRTWGETHSVGHGDG